ncbi:MAG: RNA ligase (ATP) [Planctomycetaceae bacterium]|jgi:RNA ligase (TIGR02306 family)|nr:RNA ligase (ATP) [Planctomycetaceae bacterium]
MSRKLATITKVKELFPIEGADRIEAAIMTTNNWVCVVKKGEFAVNTLGVYFEIDSFLPKENRFVFLDGRSNKTMDGVEGYRLKTVKLKKQISQGLLMPLLTFPEITNPQEGGDVTELLGVKLYEPPDTRQNSRQIAGDCVLRPFPPFVRKTDQERIQSFGTLQLMLLDNRKYEVTEKIDGTSATYYFNNGHFGVCSRNHEMSTAFDNKKFFQHFIQWITKTLFGKNSETKSETSQSVYEDMAIKYNLRKTLPALCKELGVDLAVQGEIVGTSISSNRLKLDGVDFYVFDVFNINKQEYMDAEERYEIARQLGLQHVPVIDKSYTLNFKETPIEKLIELADAPSMLSDNPREGLVYKSRHDNTSQVSFKVISNNYLLKHSL